jgi:hypothetical protein
MSTPTSQGAVSMNQDITLTKNTGGRTYDAVRDGRVVGMIVYSQHGTRTTIRHTIVDPDFRGQGIATALARYALDDITAGSGTLSNYCGFIADFIDTHPEYTGILSPGQPHRLPHDARQKTV